MTGECLPFILVRGGGGGVLGATSGGVQEIKLERPTSAIEAVAARGGSLRYILGRRSRQEGRAGQGGLVVRTDGYNTTWAGPARGFGIVGGALPSVARV